LRRKVRRGDHGGVTGSTERSGRTRAVSGAPSGLKRQAPLMTCMWGLGADSGRVVATARAKLRWTAASDAYHCPVSKRGERTGARCQLLKLVKNHALGVLCPTDPLADC